MGRRKSGEPDINLPKKRQRLPQTLDRRFAIYFVSASAVVVGLAALLASLWAASRMPSPARAVPLIGSEVRIPVADVPTGSARFFESPIGVGRPVRFFVIGLDEGTYRAALDMSEATSAGFRQKASSVRCNCCGFLIPFEQVGIASGGCRPMGIPVQVEGDSLVVRQTDLEQASARVRRALERT